MQANLTTIKISTLVLFCTSLFSACYLYKVPEVDEEAATPQVQTAVPTRAAITRSSVANTDAVVSQNQRTTTDPNDLFAAGAARESQLQNAQTTARAQAQAQTPEDQARIQRDAERIKELDRDKKLAIANASSSERPANDAFARARQRAQEEQPIIGTDARSQTNSTSPGKQPTTTTTDLGIADLPVDQQIVKDKMYRISADGTEYNILAVKWEADTLVAHVNRKSKNERRWHKNDITLVEHRQFSRGRSDALTFMIYGVLGAGAYLLLR